MISAVIAWKWTAFTGARVSSGWTAPKKRGSQRRSAHREERAGRGRRPAFAFASELLRIAKTTSRPPMPGSTSSAMKPHGSPSLNV